MTNKTELEIPTDVRVRGGTATLRIARKGYKCAECGLPIKPGAPYYCVYLGGAGLGNLKFPDRKHPDCVEVVE